MRHEKIRVDLEHGGGQLHGVRKLKVVDPRAFTPGGDRQQVEHGIAVPPQQCHPVRIAGDFLGQRAHHGQQPWQLTQPLPERWIRFEGLNTADGNREVVIDLYRVAINPAKELSIITDELLKFELSGQVLADLTKPVGGDLGQFGRLVLL